MIRVALTALILFAGAAAGAWLVVDAQQGATGSGSRPATLSEVAVRLNPAGAERYPSIVVRLTSQGFTTEASGKALAGLIEAAEVRGDPITDREARDELIAAGLLDLAVKKRGLEASEQEATDLYTQVMACLDGRATTAPGSPCSSPPPPDLAEIGDYIRANSSEAQLIEAYRDALSLGRLRSEILADLTPADRSNPAVVTQRYGAFLEGEKQSAKVVEVFG